MESTIQGRKVFVKAYKMIVGLHFTALQALEAFLFLEDQLRNSLAFHAYC
jgi:hypothetical protein